MISKYYQQINLAYPKQDWDLIKKLALISSIKQPKIPNLDILAIILESLIPKTNFNINIKNNTNKKIKKVRFESPKTKSPKSNKSRKRIVRTDIKSPKGGFGFNPPFKWAGSKRKMLKFYQDIFFPPKPIETFVDMFCGSTLVSMWVATKYPKARIILNDQNKELMDMYGVIRNNYNEFEKELLNILDNMPKDLEQRKKYYYDRRQEYCHEYKEAGNATIAADLYFMLKTNFGGLWKSGKHCNYRYSTAPGTMSMGPDFFSLDPIRKFSLFLNRCELLNGDFGSLTEFAGPGTYYYADPPYISSTVDYEGDFEFNNQDQIDLINFLKDVGDQGSWFAESNRDVKDGFWEENFPNETINYIKGVKYTAGRTHSTQYDEILVTNF